MQGQRFGVGNMEKMIKNVVKFVNEPIPYNENLEQIYLRVVEEPNKNYSKKGLIKCPECGEEILMIPTLRIMNNAIERHIHIHKEQLKNEPIKKHQTAINIRLDLMSQVLKQACRFQFS